VNAAAVACLLVRPRSAACLRRGPVRTLSPERRAAATAADPTERTAQDVRIWMLSILIGAESKLVPKGGSARLA
jgi:hypothetical protein